MKLSAKMGAALAVLAFTASAQAAFITGAINFSSTNGLVFQNSGGVATTNLAAATGVQSWGTATVNGSSGSFSSVAPGTGVVFAAPWIFNPSTAYTPLWTSGGFSFNLTSSSIVFQSASGLVVSGTGIVNGTGFDATPGTWSFAPSAGSAVGGRFSWSASTSANPAPDGGTTVALLGGALLGLHGLRRKFSRR
jgi:VPDSG-CTERM motif